MTQKERITMPKNSKPYVVGLTGGIASGKTLISDEFSRLGVPIIDTDVIAHNLVKPGQPALKEIERVFGSDIIDESGRLKRRDLRILIFSNSAKRAKLESILHPRIKWEVRNAIAREVAAYCILVIPLLADRVSYPQLNRVLVIDVDPETQIKRLMARDSCDRDQAKKALSAQISRKQRQKIADDVLENSGSQALARMKVASLHEKYLRLSAKAASFN